jgi:type I restriction enzyme S subunit
MAVFSRIYFTQLERAKRIDGEYYQPKYLTLAELHKRGQWLPIRKYLELCEYGISIKMNEKGDGQKIFRMDDLKDGFAFDHEMKFAPIDRDTLERFRLLPNDILFNRVNSEEFVGRTGIFKLTGDYVFASYLIRLRTNNGMSPDALNLFLNCKYGVLSIRRLSRRAVNQANVNAQELQSILMPRFSSDFQEILTRYSNDSWTLYTESERLYKQAEQLLLAELGLQDWKPTHALTFVGSYRGVMQAQRIDAEYFHPKYDELRGHIRSYPNGSLRITDIATNSDEAIEPTAHAEDDYRYVELADINQGIGTIESANKIKGKDAPSRARMLLRVGDVIASSVEGSLGKVALVSEEYNGAIGSTGFFVLRPRNVQSGYLLALVKSMIVREQMRCESSGTILSAVPAKSLRNVIVPNIPPKKQNEIAQLVEKSHAARREAKALLEKAKRAVEIAIEEGEDKAMEFISD